MKLQISATEVPTLRSPSFKFAVMEGRVERTLLSAGVSEDPRASALQLRQLLPLDSLSSRVLVAESRVASRMRQSCGRTSGLRARNDA
jgi:hypothetical protein